MKLNVKDQEIRLIKHLEEDYICLTDIAKWKNPDANAVIANWMRNRNVLEYLGLWEKLYNPDFKPLEFDVNPESWTQLSGFSCIRNTLKKNGLRPTNSTRMVMTRRRFQG